MGARPLQEAPAEMLFDSVLECVGGASPAPLRMAYERLRPAGIISSIGVQTSTQLEFPITRCELYDRNVTLTFGRCSAKHTLDEMLAEHPALVARAELDALFTHEVALEQVPEAYAMFMERRERSIKVVVALYLPESFLTMPQAQYHWMAHTPNIPA